MSHQAKTINKAGSLSNKTEKYTISVSLNLFLSVLILCHLPPDAYILSKEMKQKATEKSEL